MDTVKIDAKSTKMIAHRGLSGIERENTAAAFVAAGNRSYFGIETDVHKTADGQYIVIHDDSTGRVAGENLQVEQSTFAALRALHLTDRDGEPRRDLCLPSLAEYLHICKTYDKTAVLELKNHFEKADIAEILAIVEKEYTPEKLIFISFDYENMVNLRALSDKLTLQFLSTCEVNETLIEKLRRHALDLDILESRLTAQNIALLHQNGIRVNCWTADDRDRAQALADWHVDYITSNIVEGQ